MKTRFRSAVVLFALLMSLAPIAQAAPITFTYQGIGSGNLSGAPFPISPFVITAVGDTNDRAIGDFGVLSVPHLSAQISITGFGTFNFVSPTRTYNTPGSVGFSYGALTGHDLFVNFNSNDLITWDMRHDFGPLAATAQLTQWDVSPFVQTNAGRLTFNQSTGAATFQAVVAPEPTALAVFASGGAALLAVRRARHRTDRLRSM